MAAQHTANIVDQFTRQAEPFSRAKGMRDREALQRIVRAAQAGPDDTVLDVGCGPGILVCAFAPVVRHATGIDVTPAMLDQARGLQQEQGIDNVSWRLGEIPPLPFEDAEFSIVCSRFCFHHLQDPLAALKEMRRVCRPGGRVVVTDSSPRPDRAEAFNRVEKLRDPSHTRALTIEELRGLFRESGLEDPRIEQYRLEGELEDLLARSFPKPGDADRVRELFAASLEDDGLDLATRRVDGRIMFGFPVAILTATV
jgi:ubiquinone/menaquinone biosynthesis C-methylase UbiE